jgi:uncharacterized protein (TIGR02246 family)
MRRVLLTSVILGVGCLSAIAGTREDAFVVVEQFKKAYDSADPAGLVKLFAPGAIFLGTSMSKPSVESDAVLKYFQTSAASGQPKKIEIENYETFVLSESAVIFSGQDTFTQTRDGKAVTAPARFTIVAVKNSNGWQIGHFHSSARPAPRTSN